ncbi:lysophospholipase/glycerophospholipid:cholesterol acyltransferase PlaC [Legionella jordanis]|uniref:Phospholipase/lecithinase/hemolysin n=2 Tax=Legionella jordanis TaxID=456 RepID=A0A0W0VD48_9GAMM|nr:SGNH/GDSL hydrolase family protein [Legionella jordanis]KTD18053.1 phospholipase/lecithinase/hemolysin [Legionella jordanis]RMX02262.1 phospholipase [Legionella jordanis]RMX21253.1 phospholipase [Legionella jordanis]VEH13855.1 phospholipase/lecithinase/hemolysin, lysophospholipase A, glycerophospholipid-cholesterol acyltransferase [Legionella jordanis]
MSSHCTRMCYWVGLVVLCLPMTLFASKSIKSMVVFGDSLSDIGNTTHLLKSLRQDESPAYLVRPLKVFVLNKMEEFATEYYVPQVVLDAGVEIVTNFFDTEFGPFLANLVSKVKKVPVLPGEPYWQSRFSNGRVWNEYLAPMIGIDREDAHFYSNQAFGGSWAVTYDYQVTTWNLIRHPLATLKTLIVGKLIPPSLGLTVQAYLMMNESLDDRTVYFVLTGANDYLNVLVFEDNYNPAVMNFYIDNVLDGISSGVHKLVKAGARHVVVMGLPNIGITPKFVQTTDRPVLAAAVEQHNQRLQQRVAEWREQYSEVDFLYIDLQQYLQKALNEPQKYGFSNITDACIDIKFPMFHAFANSPFAHNYVLQYAQVLQYRDSHFGPNEKNYHLCDNPESYLFWDEIHPTTHAHQLLANEICDAMKQHGYETSCQQPANL